MVRSINQPDESSDSAAPSSSSVNPSRTLNDERGVVGSRWQICSLSGCRLGWLLHGFVLVDIYVYQLAVPLN